MANGSSPIPINKFRHSKIIESLALAVDHCYSNFIEGDIAEFGTNTGRTASGIAFYMNSSHELLLRKSEENPGRAVDLKRLHLFDSFRGMPKATHELDKQSPHVVDGTWGEGSLGTCDAAQILKLVGKRIETERIVIHEGFFESTVPKVEPSTRFAMLHIDCDLYQSTVDVLEPLLSRGMVSEGAAILFDDWNCNKARRETGERKAWAEAVERYNIEHSELQYYSSSGAKLLVHKYDGMPESE